MVLFVPSLHNNNRTILFFYSNFLKTSMPFEYDLFRSHVEIYLINDQTFNDGQNFLFSVIKALDGKSDWQKVISFKNEIT